MPAAHAIGLPPPVGVLAVLVVGATTDPDHGRLLLIRNSWSKYWGAGGYGWLPTDYLIAHAVQAAIVVI